MLTPGHTTLRNKSGTIAEEDVSQEVYDVKDKPKFYCLLQNVSDTDMTFDFGRKAVVGEGILLKAGQAWEPPAGVMFDGPLNIICASAGKAFVCKIA